MSLTNNIIDLIKTNQTRLEWDEYFISIAFLISSRSPSNRLKVGSVIVKDNRLISAGYNGYPAGAPHVSIVRNNHEQNAIHAEQNAVSDAAKRGVSIDNTTIYVTHFPCINCAKTIISSGINNVKYKEEYKHDDLVDQLFKISGVNVECL
jgi:dCMP deaminase